MSKLKLYWKFNSAKGLDREINKDLFAIFQTEHSTLVIAFDIATSSPVCPEMAKYYIAQFQQKIKSVTQTNKDQIQQAMHAAYTETKSAFKIGKASFILLSYCHKTDILNCFNSGDSRMGILGNQSIQWLSPVHTGANPLGQPFTSEMLKMSKRHILTRSMNLQRPFRPEHSQYKISNEYILVIATDGFWAELSDKEQVAFINNTQKASNDDTSALILTLSQTPKHSFNNNLNENLIINSNLV
ncbi:hypothetical protein [Psychromonas arctica]|uniref:hypothetical protein n=1 Tax=Psychromonas arctica TaxID=168275 RepID=UPI0004221EE4|nr:hypothetical protein [Psychromonas arctica]